MQNPVDPITAEVVACHLLATAEEMAVTLMRVSFSPNIKERGDCSTAIFDSEGQVIAQAHRIPIHLGSMIGAVAAVKDRFAEQDIHPGDMFIANDPYNGGGSHLPDINILAPVFHGGKIVAYVANIAHHADVGGMVPGSEAAVCRTIFQEGLRIPPVRIMCEGQINRDVQDLVLLNSRTPEERRGDLQAQITTNTVGVHGVTALFDRYGTQHANAVVAAFLDFTQRRFVAAIEGFADGVFEAVEYLDGDTPGEVCPIRLKLTVGDGRLQFDFTGSGGQLNSSRNIPNQALIATVYTVAKSFIDPEVPANAGYFRTIDISAPAGSVVAPRPPAAVGCRSLSCGVLGDVIAAVLGQAKPDKAIAPCGPHHLLVLSGTDPRNGRFFVDYETVAGGMGARPFAPGMDAVRVHASGAANLPIEALEHAYPFRVERYSLRQESGGTGQYPGGMGVIREYRVMADDVTVSLSGERQNIQASGLKGAGEGACGQFVLNPGTPNERVLLSAVAEEPLPRGTVLRVETPGGGGYGRVTEAVEPELGNK